MRTPEEQRTPGQKLLAAQIVSLDVDPDAAANQNVTALYSRQRIKVNDADHAAAEACGADPGAPEANAAALPVAEGVRDGDYRLTPDGPGDEPLPGKGTASSTGSNAASCRGPDRHIELPPVYFGANGMDVAEDQKSPVVEPGYLTSARRTDAAADFRIRRKRDGSSGRRRALAEWIASPENPLTARVMVNRIWYWHFGRGIVATPGNFGKMGVPPSHPELLDWLATEFVRQGWSIKQMHRLIMNSETYKMASELSTSGERGEGPDNVYLWRFPLRRLEGETIRDIILSASGQINSRPAGSRSSRRSPNRCGRATARASGS